MAVPTRNQLDSRPAMNAVAVTPSDSADLTYTSRGVYAGAAGGDLRVTLLGGDTVTFVGLAGGVIHPICATRVWSTGTTATNIVAVG